jgi:hypothetical protein
MLRFLAPPLAVMLAAAPAAAETFDKAVKANTRTAVGAFVTYWEGMCQSAGVVEPTVRTKPANGTLTVEVREITLNDKTRCPGAKARGPIFIYTPAKGFRGTDLFEVDIPWSRNEVRGPTIYTHTYRITVE